MNGHDATGPLEVASTYDASDPVAWRQWHHWNLAKQFFKLRLAKGKNILTVHILTKGNSGPQSKRRAVTALNTPWVSLTFAHFAIAGGSSRGLRVTARPVDMTFCSFRSKILFILIQDVERGITNQHPSCLKMKIQRSFYFASLIGAALLYGGNQGRAEDPSGLPDDPGIAVGSRAPAPRAPGLLAIDSAQVTPSSGGVDATTGEVQREATWRSMPGDFLHDQKDLWTFPVRLAHGKYLLPTAIVVGGTVGLIYADPHVAPYFRNHAKQWDSFTDVFDPMITTGEVIALPASLLTAGYLRHDTREVNTAILAAEAYGDSAVVNLAMKAVTRRQRPTDVPLGGSYEDTFFNGGKSPFKGSSFPSGHSTAVWSVATVVAERYRHRGKPWIPVLCYTMATAISFSRIADSAHFPSDVWLGSSLGYTIAKYQTLRPR